jgi:hypothetical protein
MCLCVRMRERGNDCVCLRGGERMYVFVCEREREIV